MTPINTKPYSPEDPQFTVQNTIPTLPLAISHNKSVLANCEGTWMGYLDWDGKRFVDFLLSFTSMLSLLFLLPFLLSSHQSPGTGMSAMIAPSDASLSMVFSPATHVIAPISNTSSARGSMSPRPRRNAWKTSSVAKLLCVRQAMVQRRNFFYSLLTPFTFDILLSTFLHEC